MLTAGTWIHNRNLLKWPQTSTHSLSQHLVTLLIVGVKCRKSTDLKPPKEAKWSLNAACRNYFLQPAVRKHPVQCDILSNQFVITVVPSSAWYYQRPVRTAHFSFKLISRLPSLIGWCCDCLNGFARNKVAGLFFTLPYLTSCGIWNDNYQVSKLSSNVQSNRIVCSAGWLWASWLPNPYVKQICTPFCGQKPCKQSDCCRSMVSNESPHLDLRRQQCIFIRTSEARWIFYLFGNILC